MHWPIGELAGQFAKRPDHEMATDSRPVCEMARCDLRVKIRSLWVRLSSLRKRGARADPVHHVEGVGVKYDRS